VGNGRSPLRLAGGRTADVGVYLSVRRDTVFCPLRAERRAACPAIASEPPLPRERSERGPSRERKRAAYSFSMKSLYTGLVLMAMTGAVATQGLQYPNTRTVDHVDVYHGT